VNRHAIGSFASVQTVLDSGWDLVRTAVPRIADPDAQTCANGDVHEPRSECVAVRLAVPRPHPTNPQLYAALIDKRGDSDLNALLTFFEAHPAARSLLDNGGELVLPEGLTWPDGTTTPRTNHFHAGSQAATQARYLFLRRVVLPDAWSSVTPYAMNAMLSAYLGPLPSDWTQP
jgi:hypothetical protein